MKCLIVTSRHGLLNWYPTFLLYAFSLSVLDLQFGFQLYFYNAVFHVVECGLEADQVSNFITRIQLPSGSPFYLRRTERSHPLYDSLSFLRRFFVVIKIKFFGNIFFIIFINNMICIVFI